jgi:glutathione synthase/RimK-type ligase-like ATP-grasp enzyme
MKTVLILYEKDSGRDILKGSPRFEDFYQYAKKHGLLFCRAPISSFDKKTGLFKRAQFFNADWFFKKNVQPDLVFDKTTFYTDKRLAQKRKLISNNYIFVNDLQLSELLSNKWLTYKCFKNFSPLAFLISSKKDLSKIKKLSSAKVILKPFKGSGGKGIKIFKKTQAKPIKYPFVAQELIEIKKGIKNFVSGAHDLRIMFANNHPFHAYLRIPKKNTLIANTSQGGKIRVVPMKNLPRSVWPFLTKIKNKLKKYPTKLYSIDIIIDDNQKPWIIELNSRPGIVLEKEEFAYKENYYNNLIKFFKTSL